MRAEPVVELAESFNPVFTPDHLDDACCLGFLNPILEVGPEKTRLVPALVGHRGGARLQRYLKSCVKIRGLHPRPEKNAFGPRAPASHILKICRRDFASIHDTEFGLLSAALA